MITKIFIKKHELLSTNNINELLYNKFIENINLDELLYLCDILNIKEEPYGIENGINYYIEYNLIKKETYYEIDLVRERLQIGL